MADEETREDQQADAQKQYLMAKVGELIDAVGPGYGEALMEELINRMERTVAHFHDEVTELLEALKKRAQERDEKLKSLMETGEAEPEAVPEAARKEAETAAEREMSEWEKRIEAKAAGGPEPSPAGEEAASKEPEPKKKGMFGRKKKK